MMQTIERLMSRTVWSGECLLWTGAKCSYGYGSVRHSGRIEATHRLIWAMTYGNPGSLCVLHKCDTPACLRIDHLFLGTKADNNADRGRKARSAWGERHKRAKLTIELVHAMRKDRDNGMSTRAIGEKYNIGAAGAWKAVTGQTWRHVA